MAATENPVLDVDGLRPPSPFLTAEQVRASADLVWVRHQIVGNRFIGWQRGRIDIGIGGQGE